MLSFGKAGRNSSLIVLCILICLLWIIRILTPAANTLSWDVFGYYLWLPAKFIQDDFWLDNIQWIRDLMDQSPISGSLYQAYIGPNGTWMYWFLMGMGVMYMPFFFIGHLWAKMGGYPANGFSMPYQISIAYGSVVYASLGLIFLWKILKKYFTELVVSIILVIIVAGTNYLHFTAIGGSATANYLFTLLAAVVWFTIRWHEKPTVIRSLFLGVLCGLIVLIKPSEVFCILIPVLWPVAEGGFKGKMLLIKKHWWHLVIICITGLIVVFPQLFYWKQEANAWIFDSYINPGIGLDLGQPHLLEVLFSFRKGWLIYTPIMIFSLIGFIFLYRQKRSYFWPILIYFLVTFYVIASWTEWWYGGGFGQRPLIVSYVVLAFPLGYFLQEILKRKVLKWFVGIAIFGLIALNLFQTWQYNNYIIHCDRMTMKYYLAVFGKTTLEPEYEKLLLVERSYGLEDEFKNSAMYACRNIGLYDFEGQMYPGFEKYYSSDTAMSGAMSFKMDSLIEFSPEIRTTYNGVTSRDHAWIKGSVYFYFPDSVVGESPLLVISTLHKGGNYKYRTYGLPASNLIPGTWQKVEFFYQTPEVRSIKDEIVIYIWNRGKLKFYVDDLRADAYTLW